MILVVNMNVSLDKHYEINDLRLNKVTRVDNVNNAPGGKGIHVANVLQAFGEECLITGFIGGKTGEFVEEKLKKRKLLYDFQKIKGETRSCLAFTNDNGSQTEILEPGPEISTDEYKKFIKKYTDLVQQASIVICSGSLPQNIPETAYEELIKIAKKYDRKVFLDTSGNPLLAGIRMKPYFIKPNHDELEILCKHKIDSLEIAIKEIKVLLKNDISLVTVSLGENGSLMGYKNKIYKISIPKVKVINPVGSGDAFVAGMAVGLQQGLDEKHAICFAAACGTANAMEYESGFVQQSVVEKLLLQIEIKPI